MSVSAVVLARDEAEVLDGCLASVSWADEIVVVVDASTRDATVEIAQRHTSRVELRTFRGFPYQRNAALELARAEWVLFVDADERVIPALAAEARRVTASPTDTAGFWIPRRNVIAGQWVRYAGWWPDHQLRLLRRGRARYDESALVHEVADLNGPAGWLGEPLLHLNYETIGELRAKQRRYAALEAAALYKRGTRARARSLIGQPLRELRRRFLELEGYRQGLLGLELAAAMAEASFVTYRELRQLSDRSERSC